MWMFMGNADKKYQDKGKYTQIVYVTWTSHLYKYGNKILCPNQYHFETSVMFIYRVEPKYTVCKMVVFNVCFEKNSCCCVLV